MGWDVGMNEMVVLRSVLSRLISRSNHGKPFDGPRLSLYEPRRT